MAKTRAHKNREIRQDAMREQLSTYGLVQQVIDISGKLAEPEVDQTRVQALKASADIKLKLIDKYIPNLQTVDSNINYSGDKPVAQMSEDELDNVIARELKREEAQDSSKAKVH
jgi:hypothetical protein